jgi:MYXO-CTERM domain-containing protein
VGHPPDLPAQGDCDAWAGTFKGNDPDMRISMRICPDAGRGGDAVKGQVQTSSLKSGYSVRDFEGRWLDGKKRLEAHDVRVVEDHPNPGWVFCIVDSYDLALRAPDELAGTVIAKECDDRSEAHLTRTPRPASSGGVPPVAPIPSEETRVKPRKIEESEPPRRAGCDCTVGPPANDASFVLLLVLLALVSRGRRWMAAHQRA